MTGRGASGWPRTPLERDADVSAINAAFQAARDGDGRVIVVHGRRPIFVGDGDVQAVRDPVASTAHGELFRYPGDQHYFLDPTLPTYDADALVMQRTLALLRFAE